MTEQQQPPDDSDVSEVLSLAERVRLVPEDDNAAGLLARRCRGRAWLGEIPAAQEAVVDVMLQFLRQYPTGSDSPLRLASTAIEPPSAIMAFHTLFPRAEFHPQAVDEP